MLLRTKGLACRQSGSLSFLRKPQFRTPANVWTMLFAGCTLHSAPTFYKSRGGMLSLQTLMKRPTKVPRSAVLICQIFSP